MPHASFLLEKKASARLSSCRACSTSTEYWLYVAKKLFEESQKFPVLLSSFLQSLFEGDTTPIKFLSLTFPLLLPSSISFNFGRTPKFSSLSRPLN